MYICCSVYTFINIFIEHSSYIKNLLLIYIYIYIYIIIIIIINTVQENHYGFSSGNCLGGPDKWKTEIESCCKLSGCGNIIFSK